MNPTLFHIKAYLRHFFTAWNTHGESIHSPYLFYIVDKLLYDKNAYYIWTPIEQLRGRLLHSDKQLKTNDYGTGQSGTKTISQIAKNELERPKNAQFFFRLIRFLSHESESPLQIVELGTSLGITTAYLATPDKHNHVTTYEGSDEVADLAQKNWKKLNIDNITLIRGNIDHTLLNNACARVDFAYIDANHTEQATLRYFILLKERAHAKSIFVLDDIHHSPEMERAWQSICAMSTVTTTMDCFDYGLVFFDPHYLNKNYKLHT